MSRTRSSEEGFTLAALLVILTIISIVIAYTVPEQWSLVMKRERDKQTIFLMKQYARGILAWQKKNNALPTSLDQLTDAKRPRVLRGDGKWPCPLSGNEKDWVLVPIGAVDFQGGGGPVPPPVPPPNTPNTPNAPPPAAGYSKLRPDASPDEYVGPFVGVRPKVKGKSFIALNGAEDYGEWVYTIQDLQVEINQRIAALSTK